MDQRCRSWIRRRFTSLPRRRVRGWVPGRRSGSGSPPCCVVGRWRGCGWARAATDRAAVERTSIHVVLIESVPNISEGRRLDVVDRLASAVTAGDGVYLLDRTSDASHNRSVFTMAGEHGPVMDALERL